MNSMDLTAFKEMHGIKAIKFNECTTGRLMASNTSFKLYVNPTKVDRAKQLFVSLIKEDKNGVPYDESFYVIHNMSKLKESNVEY
jgi:hypothetical protein